MDKLRTLNSLRKLMRQLVGLCLECCEPGLGAGYGLLDSGGSKALAPNKLLPEGCELPLLH